MFSRVLTLQAMEVRSGLVYLHPPMDAMYGATVAITDEKAEAGSEVLGSHK